MARQLRIAYVGLGLSGRTVSLATVLRARGSGDLNEAQKGTHVTFGATELEARVLVFRSWLWSGSSVQPVNDPRVADEVEYLRHVDGFVFVVDSRPFRFEAGAEALEHLRRDLAFVGRDLDRIPVVYQLNFRDEPDAVATSELVRVFVSGVCSCVESIAIRGVGTVEAIESLLRLIGHETDLE